MRDALFNFIGLKPQNVIEPLYWLLAAGWVVFVFTAIQSILSRRMGALWKAFWILLVTAVPGAGLFVYLVFCLLTADYSFLERFGLAVSRPKR
jgi:hypothetical protein